MPVCLVIRGDYVLDVYCVLMADSVSGFRLDEDRHGVVVRDTINLKERVVGVSCSEVQTHFVPAMRLESD